MEAAVGVRAKNGSRKTREKEQEAAVEEGQAIRVVAAVPVRKKSKKEKDPFKIPPGAYNGDVFEIREPFVTVLFSDKVSITGEQDKVLDEQEMDPKALKAAMRVMCAEYIFSSRCSKSESKELGFRDAHTSLAKAFWLLTTPSSRQQVLRKEVLRRTRHLERVPGLEALEDLQVVMDEGKEHTAEDTDEERPSTKSLDVQFEGDEGETSGSKSSPQFDLSFRVIDKRVDIIDKSVVVLVVKCKWGSLTLDDIYRVAAYTCTLAKENLGRGRYKPIYMEVWDDRSWRYAIFYPEGIVQVEDSEVKGVIKSSTSMHDLQCKLTDRISSLAKRYPNAQYPDGNYLEGILFISMQKFFLPSTAMRGGGMTDDAKLFYQSKLRIVVGDKVLAWTEEDVERAVEKRKGQLEAGVNRFLFE